MFWIVASLIAVLVLFVVLGNSKTGWRLRGRQVLCVFGAALVLGGMVATVPTGHTGILTTFGKVEDKTLEAGMHVKSPFQEIVCMDNRTQVAHLELSAFSSDIQEVLVSYSMNYQIEKANAQKIYKEIGVDYYNTVMAPRIQEVVKSVIAKYTAEEIEGIGFAIPSNIAASVAEDLINYGYVKGRPALGVTVVTVSANTWDTFANGELSGYLYENNSERYGVYIISSRYSSDLKKGDRIVSINGEEISSNQHISNVISRLSPGSVATLVVERVSVKSDGSVAYEQKTVKLLLRERDWADEIK